MELNVAMPEFDFWFFMRLPFDSLLDFTEFVLKVWANIFNCKSIWEPSNENLSLCIPLFEVNIFLTNFEVFLCAEGLDLAWRDHEESLELSFLFSELDMLHTQIQLGKTAYDKRLHL